MDTLAPTTRAMMSGATRDQPRNVPPVVEYTLAASGTLSLPNSSIARITYTGAVNTTATVIVDGVSHTIKNEPGTFDCGTLIWDYLGPNSHVFWVEGNYVEETIGDFHFMVQWEGCGSHIFLVVPFGFTSPYSSPLPTSYFSSAWSLLEPVYFDSSWATTIDIYTHTPGGFLTWTNQLPNGQTELHGERIAETIEGSMDTGPLVGITKINSDEPNPVEGATVVSPPYREPTVYRTTWNEPRVLSVSNNVPVFVFDDNGKREKSLIVPSQYAPRKTVAHSHKTDMASATLYLESGNLYFATQDEEKISSSSSSTSSVSSISSSSISSISSSSSADDIRIDGVTSGHSSYATTLTFNHTISGNSNRILVVGVQAERDGIIAPVTTSVTYNGQNLHQIITHSYQYPGNEAIDNSDLWCILESDLPTAGTYAIVVTMSNALSKSVIAGVISIYHAKQEYPILTSFNHGQHTVASTINGVTEGSLIIDSLSSGTWTSNPVTTGIDQIRRYKEPGGRIGNVGCGSTRVVTNDGDVTFSWYANATLVQVVAEFKAFGH